MICTNKTREAGELRENERRGIKLTETLLLMLKGDAETRLDLILYRDGRFINSLLVFEAT